MISRFDSHHLVRSIIPKVFHFVLVLMCSASGHISLNGAISDDFLCSLMGCLLKPMKTDFLVFIQFYSLHTQLWMFQVLFIFSFNF